MLTAVLKASPYKLLFSSEGGLRASDITILEMLFK
jgi:hypothetical protein